MSYSGLGVLPYSVTFRFLVLSLHLQEQEDAPRLFPQSVLTASAPRHFAFAFRSPLPQIHEHHPQRGEAGSPHTSQLLLPTAPFQEVLLKLGPRPGPRLFCKMFCPSLSQFSLGGLEVSQVLMAHPHGPTEIEAIVAALPPSTSQEEKETVETLVLSPRL